MPTTLPRAIAFLIGFWLALALLGPLVHPPAARGDGGADPALASLESRLHDEVNRTRAAHHRVPLRRLAALDRAARAHSIDMATRRYLAHESPEGLDPVQRIELAGAEGFTLAGENVGMTTRRDPNREILREWLLSPVHRENLLAPAFNATGIGIARANDGALYYTQVYATFPQD